MLTILKAIKFAINDPKEVIEIIINAFKTIPILYRSPIQSQVKGIWRYIPNKYVLESLQMGIPDTNDYLETPHHHAENSTKMLFENLPADIFQQTERFPLNVLEVGAGTGRFSREVVKYLPTNTRLLCLEYNRPSYEYLKQYLLYKKLDSVSISRADFYNNGFTESSFKLVLIPWFTFTMNLFSWAKLFKEANRLLETGGYLAVDYMDSQKDLIRSVTIPHAAPYYLINGNDLVKIADYYSLKKVSEFTIDYKQLNDTFQIYQKTS
jgi:ubiquinone/menaquinone biosynthesis C-methylase UbiE